jgi:hypothetical protein
MKDYCTIRTMMTRAGKMDSTRIGMNDLRVFSVSGSFCIHGTFDYYKEDSQKEEWDERRAFGYDVT